MATIPQGNFVLPSVQAPVRTGAADNSGALAEARALQGLGETGMQAGGRLLSTAGQMAAKEREESDSLARAKAANAILDQEIATKSITENIANSINDGTLDWRKAGDAYQTEVSKLQRPDIPGLQPDDAERFGSGLKRAVQTGSLAVQNLAKGAQRVEFKSQFYLTLDKLGKLAGDPNADIDKINQQAEAFVPLARQANLDEATITARVQQFKDTNWSNQAKSRLLSNVDNVEGLDNLQRDLTDEGGYYANKLDTDKRNAVLSQVITAKSRLEAKAQHEEAKKDAIAKRAMDGYDRQVSSGVPAPVDYLQGVADAVKGTDYEEEFRQRVKDEIEIRQVMQKPPVEQRAYVAELQAKQQRDGATVQEQANLRRLQSGIESNLKQLRDAPLLFNANRTGEPAEPLDVNALAAGDVSKAQSQFADRMVTIRAMRKQYGSEVGNSPLLPGEASMMAAAINMMPPKGALQLFGGLSHAINDPDAYEAAIQQIAPDSPVRALAGRIYAKQDTNSGGVTKGTPGADAGNVAMLMVRGEALLNPGKAEAKEDGKGARIKMPSNNDLDAEIADAVGAAYAGRSTDYRTANQAVRAVYAAKSVDAGDMSGELDSKRLRESIAAVVGEPARVGGREVIPPWGMSSDRFEDQAETYIDARFKAAGIENPGNVGLLNVPGRDGVYILTRGMQPLVDKRGQPLLIRMRGDQ